MGESNCENFSVKFQKGKIGDNSSNQFILPKEKRKAEKVNVLVKLGGGGAPGALGGAGGLGARGPGGGGGGGVPTRAPGGGGGGGALPPAPREAVEACTTACPGEVVEGVHHHVLREEAVEGVHHHVLQGEVVEVELRAVEEVGAEGKGQQALMHSMKTSAVVAAAVVLLEDLILNESGEVEGEEEELRH
ncbi:hypothetical protein ACMD2_19123 [Ananas comosus]|uniref:Uncharacterized protein n=1 Tax=Ananas comosus TaxID=4615 RepID=A0A199VTY2_ANACO|nr:hypothetical protein ACMD2_19123 [Ananas comosus]